MFRYHWERRFKNQDKDGFVEVPVSDINISSSSELLILKNKFFWQSVSSNQSTTEFRSMELNPDNRKVYLRPGITDLRKSINRLSIIVEGGIKKNAYSESFFLFCNRKKDKLKMFLIARKRRQNKILTKQIPFIYLL